MSMRQPDSSFRRDDTNASLVHLFEVRLQKLKRLFVIEDQQHVQKILKTYPSLLPTLLDAHQNIQRYFPGSEVMLDATVDPDGLTATMKNWSSQSAHPWMEKKPSKRWNNSMTTGGPTTQMRQLIKLLLAWS